MLRKLKLPIRSALLLPLLSLGLLLPGVGGGQTRADALPEPCGVTADAGNPDAAAESTVLLLSVILNADAPPALAAELPRPSVNAPTPGREVITPKPPGTDLRPPSAALLSPEPIEAVRQFRETLTEKQKADLQGVLMKHRAALQQARADLPEPSTDERGARAVSPDRQARLARASTELTRIGDQVDQDIEPILTPQQRALLQKANPKQRRGDMPESLNPLLATGEPGC